MSIYSKITRYDTATYWEPDSVDASGQKTYLAPREIECRWDDEQTMFRSKNDKDETSRSVVYVQEDLALDGVLLHGTLANVTDDDDPFANVGAFEIQAFSKIGNIRQTKFLRRAFL